MGNNQQFVTFEIKKIIQSARNQKNTDWNNIVQITNEQLVNAKNQLEITDLKINSLNYRNVLEQGYVIVLQND